MRIRDKKILIRDGKTQKSRIQDKHPGSATVCVRIELTYVVILVLLDPLLDRAELVGLLLHVAL